MSPCAEGEHVSALWLLACETDARLICYGAMLMESFVAIMVLVAASIIEPGLYFAMNTPPAALGITMPNLHELGGENAPMIMAQLNGRHQRDPVCS